MKQKIVLEIKSNPMDGDILVYNQGSLEPVEIHDLLPDLRKAKQDLIKQGKEIDDLKAQVADLIKKVKELRGED